MPVDIGKFKAGSNYISDGGGRPGIPELNDDCLDSDKDGLSNFYERKYDTDKLKSDTDGDGYLDGDEVINDYNPNGPGKLLK